MKQLLIIALLFTVACKGELSGNNLPEGDPTTDQKNNQEDDPTFTGNIPDISECKDVAVDPGPFNARRLTDWEYVRTIDHSFGLDVSTEALEELPRDYRVNGFTNTGPSLITNIDHVKAYETIAALAISKINDWNSFVLQYTSCTDSTDACQREFIERAGLRAFRRPLVEEEIAAFLPLFQMAIDEGDDYNIGAQLVFRAMLQSPQFLFRLEKQEGADSDLRDVDGYEMASRLSYLIWVSSPDDDLYAAAAADELKTDEQIAFHVDRMLADPKAREASRRYVRDWLALDNADDLVREPDLYPEFGPSLVTAMKQETLTFFEKQLWEDQVPILDLFTAKHTYANRELANFYGFDGVQEGVQRYDLTNHPERIGFLTHAGILAVSGKADEPSLVERGLFVMNGIFCDVVTSELDVVPELGPIEPGKTQRYYADERLDEPGCARCHNQFDPYGMPFERFDGIGRYLTQDIHGNDLQEDGEFIDSISGETVGFSSIAEFVEKAAQTEGARDCMIKKPVQFALGRPLLQTDACMLAEIKTDFDPATATYQDLIRSIASNPYFKVVRSASVDQPAAE